MGGEATETSDGVRTDRVRALEFLRRATGRADAEFRDGQWEAIEGIMRNRRQLVVQRTGWGKSMIYFLAAKFLREEGRGMTLLISPLLALMRNQVAAARRIGLRCDTINCNCTKAENDKTMQLALAGEIDLLLVSPERLANETFQTKVLEKVSDSIGLLVVDEAHCISDWGHAFRPDYKKIVRLLSGLAPNVPVLATTATANGRVIEDVKAQLGEGTEVSRGSLVRDSLYLQNIRLDTQEERLAWLAQELPKIDGTGVVYALTVRDSERVARWLRQCGISAYAYSGGCLPPDDMDAELRADYEEWKEDCDCEGDGGSGEEAESGAYRRFLEEALLVNRVKALVATSALSMGFDKPDMTFVVHFQRPKSVVDYYQQVGRAGRGVKTAHGILLNGKEDDSIAEYFISSAFPHQDDVEKILAALLAGDGLSRIDLMKTLNLRAGKIDMALRFLTGENPQPIVKTGAKYAATPAALNYRMPRVRIARFTRQLRDELRRMDEYVRHEGCLMDFLCRELDTPPAEGGCGHCGNCRRGERLAEAAAVELVQEAAVWLSRAHVPIVPRKRWSDADTARAVFGAEKSVIPPELMLERGMALTAYGSGRWGRLVAQCKYRAAPPRFDDRLVEAFVEMFRGWRREKNPVWVAYVPSLRHPELVRDFARRFAEAAGMEFSPCVVKVRETEEQKRQANSYMQQNNVISVFAVRGETPKGHCLLIDDMVDSRWTLTVVGALLRKAGAASVTPMVLADSSNSGE